MKVGRNDPCPCGSGKKYKKCCYPDKTHAWKTAGSHQSPAFAVRPRRVPAPITEHLVSSDGGKTWEAQPGLLAARLYLKRQEDVDKAIDEVIQSVMTRVDGLGISQASKQEFVQRVMEVQHKLYGVKYHLSNYQHAETEKTAEFQKSFKASAGVQMVVEEPRLIYEVEAFLFQTKSCLDILTWTLKPVFGFKHCSFGDKGDDIVRQLRHNSPKALADHAAKIVNLIEDAQESWVVDLIEMRDEITHISRLEGFNCFVEDPYVGGDSVGIHYPTMPNQRRALEYCCDVWQRLITFCQSFLALTIRAAQANPSKPPDDA